jgi:iron-sulfur cluster assembly protein
LIRHARVGISHLNNVRKTKRKLILPGTIINGKGGMLDITKSARKRVREIVDREEALSPIRIMMAGGCIGPQLGMLFDCRRPDDTAFEVEGIQYVIKEELLLKFQPITLDYRTDASGGRFSITSPKCDSES